MCNDRVSVCVFARLFIAMGLVTLSCVHASHAEEKEPFAVIQLGGAGEWGLPNGGSSFGPTVAVEFTAIKNWLEIEAGVTSLFRRGQSEWDSGIMFKKPFELSPYLEFEPGLGPVWMHTVSLGRASDALGAELAFEFMIWPTRDRKYGWFIEPSYGYSFGKDHEQSFGVNAGLLIAIP
jgi:hypothetical protein